LSEHARRTQLVLRRIERERAEGLDVDDAASRWLAENDPAPAGHVPSRTIPCATRTAQHGCAHTWATIVPVVRASYRYCLHCGIRGPLASSHRGTS
jgi:hypothetical protein